MHIERVEQFDEIPLNREQWNNMVKYNHTNTIFQTYEWFESWWRSLGRNNQLVFLIAYDFDQIVGFAPLMIVNNLYSKKSLHFASDKNSDYCDFVINGNYMKTISAFLEYLNSCFTQWNSMVLQNIPSESITLACLQTICQEKDYNISIKRRIKAPALLIENQHNHALSLINKYSVTRHLKKVIKLGNLEFINLNKRDDIMNYLDMFFDQHIERYRIKNMVSQFINPDNRQLYIDLVNNLNHTDWLLFSVLLLDDRPIAFHFGFNYNNKIIWYKPSFSPSYKAYSPGTLMLKHLVEYAIDTDRSELDFTIGDESFKSRFSNCTRYNQNVVIYRSKILCFVLVFIRKISRNFYQALRWFKQ